MEKNIVAVFVILILIVSSLAFSAGFITGNYHKQKPTELSAAATSNGAFQLGMYRWKVGIFHNGEHLEVDNAETPTNKPTSIVRNVRTGEVSMLIYIIENTMLIYERK